MPLRQEQFSNRDELHGYLDGVPRKDYILASHFPEEEISDFDFSYELLEGGYAPTAEITALDASAPLTDFEDVKEAFNEVVMIKHGFRINEKRALKYAKPRDERERESITEFVYRNVDRHVEGVWDMVEYLRAQAAYYGVVQFTNSDADNNVVVNVDFKLDAQQKTTAATPWGEAGSTPLQDLIAAAKSFRERNGGRNPEAIHMTKTKFNELMFNDAVRQQILGSASDSAQIITTQQVNAVVQSVSLPPIVVNEQVVNLPKSGLKAHLEDNRVVLLASELGTTMIGPSVQRDYEPGIFGNVELAGDPPKQSMQVGITAFPALKNKNGIHILEA